MVDSKAALSADLHNVQTELDEVSAERDRYKRALITILSEVGYMAAWDIAQAALNPPDSATGHES